MICDILIRSYYKDFKWLQYCLRSIDKYCRGFRHIILVVPQSSLERLYWLGITCNKIIACTNYSDDYLGQQVTKMYADTLTDADFICHVDSDCIFYRPLFPQDLFKKDKLSIALTHYTQLPDDIFWKTVAQKFLKQEVEYNFMRRQPHTFPRWIYQKVRDYASMWHQIDMESYILSQGHQAFSEFNILGAYAYYYHPNEFTWIEMSKNDPNEMFCRWYWSWGGIQPHIYDEIQRILS